MYSQFSKKILEKSHFHSEYLDMINIPKTFLHFNSIVSKETLLSLLYLQ